jgi:galactokinase/mevalonate kinase-like predicted kinase
LESLQRDNGGWATESSQELRRDRLPLPYDGDLDLLKGSINRLYRYSPEFREKLGQRGVRISTWTDVPRQSGLGGSSLFVLLALAGLREFYALDRHAHNDYILAELTQRVEAKELGITCGFADRYVPLFGGIAYLDYRGKLHHLNIRQEPYVTYERLDQWVDDLPLVAISTGVVRDSGDVHGRMRPRYLQEYAEWYGTNGAEWPQMVRYMSGAWEVAWRGKIALLERDWETFGALMNQNHQLVNDMMTYCGFSDGAGWANNLCIEVALKSGALGAKLTGAGSGGSVFALTRPGEEGKLMEIWKQTAVEAGLDSAHVYRPHISRQGLAVEVE